MKADHVTLDFSEPRPPVIFAPENQLVCRCGHCGDRYVLGLPVSVSMAAIVMKQYTREHRHCKKAPGPPNVSPEPDPSPRGVRAASEASATPESNIEGTDDAEM